MVTNGATLTVGSGTLASGAALFVEAGGTLGTTGTGATLVGGAVSLADGAALLFNFTECAINPPKWVKGVRIVDGDIVVEIKPTGLMLIVK